MSKASRTPMAKKTVAPGGPGHPGAIQEIPCGPALG